MPDPPTTAYLTGPSSSAPPFAPHSRRSPLRLRRRPQHLLDPRIPQRNWTIQETLILITAKKLDDERRLRTSGSSSTPQEPSKPGAACSSGRTSGELCWKWVESYCWSRGCLQSQNQCNDKWDNSLRDYKKVRDYESRAESSSSSAVIRIQTPIFLA